MLFEDCYKTITRPSEGIFRDKGSKFTAYAFPVRSEEEAKQYISQIKAEHPKARHHCWALRLSPDKTVFRINDDGEPSGTAGRPILNVLLSNELTNIIVIVVRYFGGTLLGVPGLINAYKNATIEAVKAAHIVELTVNDIYSISFNYIQVNEVMRIIKEFDLNILNKHFDISCILKLEIPKAKLNAVISKLEKLEDLSYTYLYTS